MTQEPVQPAGRFRALRRLFRGQVRDEVEDEIAFHLAMREQEQLARGADPARAHELALARFGDVAQARDESIMIMERMERKMARTEYLAELRQDIAYALRSLRLQPGFAIVVILTLALGIGANSALFSVVNAVLVKGLPYANASELVLVQSDYANGEQYPLSAPDFASIAEWNRVYGDIGGFAQARITLTGVGDPVEVRGALLTEGLLDMVGARVVLGRPLQPADHEPGAPDVVVLSHGLWQRMFGGVPDVLGRTLTLSGSPYEIVGVLEAGREIPADAELFGAVTHDSTFNATTPIARRGEYLNVVARLRPGVSPATADAEMKRIGADLQRQFPGTNDRITFSATPLADILLGDVRTPLLVLLGAVGLVLLVACANVANLLLARATARTGELAVRAALGAGRGRLVRQLLTESLVLAVLGGAIGLVLAYLGTRALVAAQPADIPQLDRIAIDGTVVGFTAVVTVLTALLFGALPALQSTGGRLMATLRASGRGGPGGGQRVRSALVVAELAFAVMLLVGAGLLIRSFVELTRVDPGFRAENTASIRVALQGPRYDAQETRRIAFAQLTERLRALPGVQSVGATTSLPATDNAALFSFAIPDGPPLPPDLSAEIRVVIVTPEYFRSIGGALRSGRMFEERDGPDAPPVALVNQAAVDTWFRDRDPIGVRVDANGEREIIGVVGNVLQVRPGEPDDPELYIPYAQLSARNLYFTVRTSGDPIAVSPQIRQIVRDLDPSLPLEAVRPLDDVLGASIARPRFYTTLLALFAGLALGLAVIGIFGVMSYVVAQRRREIGIRMALGADRMQVLRMIVGTAAGLAALGLAIGFAGILAVGGALRSQLYGVSTTDPLTMAVVLGVLGVSALGASIVPARRAARLDPGSTLRDG
ncbi:MAG TPA: ABC transporter permease [Longimicrobiales bacterium]